MSTESIGLDIGSDTVKLVQLFANKSDSEIHTIAHSEARYSSSAESLANSIESLFTSHNLKPNNVRLSISGPSVVVRYAKLPKMSKDELRGAVAFEAEKCIPYPIDEVYVDYLTISEDGDDSQLPIMIVAAKKVAVDNLLTIMDSLNIAPLSINLDTLATVNAFFHSKAAENAKGKRIVLLNMGAKFANLNVVEDGKSYFLRDIQLAGNDIGSQVKKNLPTLKTESTDFLDISQSATESVGADEFETVLKASMRNLLNELRLSFGYCENQYGIAIEEAYISGGLAQSDIVIQIMEKSLGIQLNRWNPFDNSTIGDSIENYDALSASQYAVSMGLALEGME